MVEAELVVNISNSMVRVKMVICDEKKVVDAIVLGNANFASLVEVYMYVVSY